MTPNYKPVPISDGIAWNNPAPDYLLDSGEFIDKFEENLASEEGLTDAEFKAVPDAHLSEATTGYSWLLGYMMLWKIFPNTLY